MGGGSFGVDLLPGGVFGFIRKRIYKDGEMTLKLHLNKSTGKWCSESNWKPFTGLEADTPEALLIEVAQMLEPDIDS